MYQTIKARKPPRKGHRITSYNVCYTKLLRNDKTSGFGKGDLVIVAARPAMGKTAFVLNIALKAIERDEGVAFFSLEMPAEQLMLRMLAAKTSIRNNFV